MLFACARSSAISGLAVPQLRPKRTNPKPASLPLDLSRSLVRRLSFGGTSRRLSLPMHLQTIHCVSSDSENRMDGQFDPRPLWQQTNLGLGAYRNAIHHS